MNEKINKELGDEEDYKGLNAHGRRLSVRLKNPYSFLITYKNLFLKTDEFKIIDPELKSALNKVVTNGLKRFGNYKTDNEVKDLLKSRMTLLGHKVNDDEIDKAFIFYPLANLLRLQHDFLCEFDAILPHSREAETFDVKGDIAKKLIDTVKRAKEIMGYNDLKDLQSLSEKRIELAEMKDKYYSLQVEFISIIENSLCGLQPCIDNAMQFASEVALKQGQNNPDAHDFLEKICDTKDINLPPEKQESFFERMFKAISNAVRAILRFFNIFNQNKPSEERIREVQSAKIQSPQSPSVAVQPVEASPTKSTPDENTPKESLSKEEFINTAKCQDELTSNPSVNQKCSQETQITLSELTDAKTSKLKTLQVSAKKKPLRMPRAKGVDKFNARSNLKHRNLKYNFARGLQ